MQSLVLGLFAAAMVLVIACGVLLVAMVRALRVQKARLEALQIELEWLEQSVAPPKVPSKAQRVVALAKSDLAKRLGIDSSAILKVEPVEWPDSCLGCASPDTACAQVITPGFRIVLEAIGEEWVYHSSHSRISCPERDSAGL